VEKTLSHRVREAQLVFSLAADARQGRIGLSRTRLVRSGEPGELETPPIESARLQIPQTLGERIADRFNSPQWERFRRIDLQRDVLTGERQPFGESQSVGIPSERAPGFLSNIRSHV